ncbi:MAG: hypothetical protein AB7D05_11355, partial [Mangrovibacterium sp.]
MSRKVKKAGGKRILCNILYGGTLLFLLAWIVAGVSCLQSRMLPSGRFVQPENMHTKEAPSPEELKTDIFRLKEKLKQLVPRAYLVVNTTDNTFFLFQRGKLIRQGICSTGSYVRLEVNEQK